MSNNQHLKEEYKYELRINLAEIRNEINRLEREFNTQIKHFVWLRKQIMDLRRIENEYITILNSP